MIRILLADDHPLVRDGLRLILEPEPDLEVLEEAGDYDELLRLVNPRVDVVVTDISMPGVGIDRAIEELGQQWPDLPVLIISMCEQRVLQERARRLGANGSLDKGRASKELPGAIRAVAGGKPYPAE